jgi:CHAT domain-containing protein/tetratricopeptide (TPR) repeat protein
LKRSLAIKEGVLGSDHPSLAFSLNTLANIFREQGRLAEAELLCSRSIMILEKALPADHPHLADAVNTLGLVSLAQGRYIEADQLFGRSLAIEEKALGPDHTTVGRSLNNLAGIHFTQRHWDAAASYWVRSTNVVVQGAKRTNAFPLIGKGMSETDRHNYRFWGLVKAMYRRSDDPNARLEAAAETFESAQWSHTSRAAGSLAQMSARQAKGDGFLSRLIRERQDLSAEWQAKEELLTKVRSQLNAIRNAEVDAALSDRLQAIDNRVGTIDKALAKDFPEYAALSSVVPLTIADVQAQLHDQEVLILFLDTPAWGPTPDETFIWVVTKSTTRWVRSDIGKNALKDRVAALRCGLDRAAWDGDADGGARCISVPGSDYSAEDAKRGKPLPFDLARSNELYMALFGQVEDMIKDKHLLIVPSGSLTSFPFQVLVTEKPADAIPQGLDSYGNAAWLTKRHAITVLPSVGSLRALRQFAKASKATEPFMGFGNPLLLGPDGNDKRAWERQSCNLASSAKLQFAGRGVRSVFAKFFRGGLANVEEVRAQYPLPETADELCAVAQSSGGRESSVYLGEKASEKNVKGLSAAGTLAEARVVHFATHGLLAGETEMLAASKAEPALLLTPPQTASEEDDGLLTASEITQLRLNADWVVLSACNTAAGDKDKLGAEALSGLARAFFYAGARALLVSHWAVNSEATVKLITRAFEELRSNPNIGRSESLRRSMRALIERGDAYAHPANWGPFVVVGEGASH